MCDVDRVTCDVLHFNCATIPALYLIIEQGQVRTGVTRDTITYTKAAHEVNYCIIRSSIIIIITTTTTTTTSTTHCLKVWCSTCCDGQQRLRRRGGD
jgi:hypothetical protein